MCYFLFYHQLPGTVCKQSQGEPVLYCCVMLYYLTAHHSFLSSSVYLWISGQVLFSWKHNNQADNISTRKSIHQKPVDFALMNSSFALKILNKVILEWLLLAYSSVLQVKTCGCSLESHKVATQSANTLTHNPDHVQRRWLLHQLPIMLYNTNPREVCYTLLYYVILQSWFFGLFLPPLSFANHTVAPCSWNISLVNESRLINCCKNISRSLFILVLQLYFHSENTQQKSFLDRFCWQLQVCCFRCFSKSPKTSLKCLDHLVTLPAPGCSQQTKPRRMGYTMLYHVIL